MKPKILAGTVPLIAGLAFAVVPAVASATVTIKHAKGGAALKEGEAIEALSNDLEFKFSSGGGNFNCERTTLRGAMLENAAEPARASITEALFKGQAGVDKTNCESSLLGQVEVEMLGLPGQLSLNSSEEAKLTAHEEGPVVWHMQFTGGSGQECTYSIPSLSFTFKAKESLVKLKVDKKQEFTREEPYTVVCPSTGTLSGEFTVTSPGSAEPELEIET